MKGLQFLSGELNEQLFRVLAPSLGVRAASSDEADAEDDEDDVDVDEEEASDFR